MPGLFKRWSKAGSGSVQAAEPAAAGAANTSTGPSQVTTVHALPEQDEYTHDGDEQDEEEQVESDDDEEDLFKFTRPQTGQTQSEGGFNQNHGQQADRLGVAYTNDEPQRGGTAITTASSQITARRYPRRGATGASRSSNLARPDTGIAHNENISTDASDDVVVVTPPQQYSADVPTSASPPSEVSPPGTTEAQRIAKQYKLNDHTVTLPSAAVTAIGGLHHRRQGYAYPTSPIHTAGLQEAAALRNTAAHPHGCRTPTPVIELAEDEFHAASDLARQTSRTRNDTDPQPPTYHSGMTYGSGRELGDLASLTSSQFDATRSVASTQTTHQKLFTPIDAVYDNEKLDYDGTTIATPTNAYSRKRHPNTFEMAELGNGSGAPGTGSTFPTSSFFANGRHHFASVRGHTAASGIDDKITLSAFQLDEEDSPYPEVAASVSNYDDPNMPCCTFRAIFLGLLFTMCGAAFNFFFLVRQPSPMLTPITVQVLAYPAGKLLDRILPVTDYRVPKWLQRLGLPQTFSLNPGPFNVKEHAVITIMANVSISPSYALNTSITLDHFYLVPKGIGFDLLFTISTSFIGFSFAGMCRRFLVWPASVIWPQNLVTCTLFNTFHAEEDDPLNGTSRFRMFLYISCGAFCWYFLPGFIFSAMSWFSFVCWIWPEHRIVNQLFGVASGLGMSAISLDWTQIAYVCSPLFVPWFAIVNIFVGFVFIYWFIVPLIYYTNVWNFAYLPISSDANFDRFGMPYNVSAVITPDIHIDEAAYMAYSPLFISTTFAVVYALSFVLMTALVAHTALYHGAAIWRKFRHVKTEEEDVHAKLMRNYPEVPDWWYAAIFIVFAGVAIAAIEGYKTDLPVWALLLAVLIPAIYILPGGFVYSITAQLITVNLIAELIPGYLLPNKPIPNMIFKTFSIQCLQSGLYFIQDLKLGHYMKIPPRVTFHVQILATLCASVAQVAMKKSLSVIVKDLCSPEQSARMNCAIASVTFQASIIWGVIGPARFFGNDSVYQALLYFLLLGLVLPIPFYLASKRWPKSWITYVNIPVLINGVTFIPPASGINYSSWFLAGGVFQYYLRRHRFRWWSRYNFVTSAGLDAGTVLSTVFIFFTLQLPKNGGLRPDWWGNSVYTKTFDWAGVPFKDAPPEGFGPTTWS